MITFKPLVFFAQKRKDGQFNVKIRITFHGVSRFIPTTLYCTKADLTRQGKIKNGDILSKGNALCDQMRHKVTDLSPFELEGKTTDWVVDYIKREMSGDDFHLDFFEWGEAVSRTKNSYSARTTYASAVNVFRKWRVAPLDINDITAILLKDFVRDYNEANGQGCGERVLVRLRNIYNLAQSKYNDEDSGKILIPRHPFSCVPLKTPPSLFSF